MSEEEEEEYSLKESAEGVGELVPVIKDAYGNVIDGFHRLRVDPNWPAIRLTRIDDPIKLELARLAVNYCRRRVPKEELQAKIEFLIKTGGLTPEEISRKTGISLRTIYRYMPDELKNQYFAELGRKPKQEYLTKQDSLPIGNESEVARHVVTAVTTNIETQETQERKSEQAITVPASASVAPTLPSSQPKSLVEEPPLVRIIDKLKRYYPLSLIDWVYEFYQFSSAEQGAKLLKQVLEAVWSRIEKELGEEWIRNVVSEAIRQ